MTTEHETMTGGTGAAEGVDPATDDVPVTADADGTTPPQVDAEQAPESEAAVAPEAVTPGTAEAEPAGPPAVESEQAAEAAPATDLERSAAVEAAEPEPVSAAASMAEAEPEGEPPAEAAGAEPEPAAEPEPEPAAEAAPAAEPELAAEPESATEPESAVEAAPAAEPETPRTVGRYVADALRAVGVRYAFTVPGESFLGLLEGLDGAGIRVVATRHEGAAAFMAEAHGQLTSRPAACVATRAVGAANLAIGIHTARQDSTPMFALVGQVERPFLGREAFQEIDQAATIGGLAAHATEVRRAEDVPAAVGATIRAALAGRPGPALLAIPEDLLDEELPAGTALETARPTPDRPEPDEVRAVLQLLASAERPVILAGGGVLRARTSTDLTRLAELLDVPVIAGWRRGDVISNDHPLYLGMAGYGSPHTVRQRLETADAIAVIGCRLSEVTSFGYAIPRDGQPWAHVDAEPRGTIAGLPSPTIRVRSDARAFLRAAVQRLQAGVLDAARVDARRVANGEDRAAWEAATEVPDDEWSGPGVDPRRTFATLRRVLPDDAIVTTDAGNFGLWLARHFRFRRPGTFLGPTSGAMGYALPAAIAAALVHRDRAVVAVAGDGGFAMTMAELETAVREKVRVVAIVFDNERYGTIAMHQARRSEGVAIGTDLGPLDFAAVARACGAQGIAVESDPAFEPALRRALASDRPTVLHLTLDRQWVAPNQTPE
ncbi:MAG TPA: thiamine pyrophosphate-dependent enzyme [Candidatus Limnocylindrales bacterium]|nr:thiamine pyrophosphate-dependent enzyme [Candidatus Limnocylindrales bacterium]